MSKNYFPLSPWRNKEIWVCCVPSGRPYFLRSQKSLLNTFKCVELYRHYKIALILELAFIFLKLSPTLRRARSVTCFFEIPRVQNESRFCSCLENDLSFLLWLLVQPKKRSEKIKKGWDGGVSQLKVQQIPESLPKFNNSCTILRLRNCRK